MAPGAYPRGVAEVKQQSRPIFSYRLDFHRLMALTRKLGDPICANVFGSVTDGNEGLWPHAEAAGLEVQVVERSISGKEKRLDAGVVTHVCRDAYLLGQPGRDRITLVAGDGDYEQMVRQPVQDGFAVTLLYWSRVSRELPAVASRFYPFEDCLEDLALR